MKMLKTVIRVIRDIFEVYIPSLVFVLMFIVFVLQIFFRYILKSPLTWTMECTLICFCYIVTLGACYAARKQTHVIFTLVYDSVKAPFKYILSMCGNLIIIAAFLIMLKPSFSFIRFMSFQKTSVLKLGMNIVFAPFLILLLSVIFYQTVELLETLLSMKRGEDVFLIDRDEDTALGRLFKKNNDIKLQGGIK
ncbi:TRAP transporter small permease [Treponema sp. HNW]|uniref:TRAP transporter small permease n=1 Tax=Treponema sp. HNW TaxID=3116654 RepID=UPI003D142617